eukprot:5644598-Amphidinium_carterae.2
MAMPAAKFTCMPKSFVTWSIIFTMELMAWMIICGDLLTKGISMSSANSRWRTVIFSSASHDMGAAI